MRGRRLAAAVALAFVPAASSGAAAGAEAPAIPIGGPFTLTDHAGTSRRDTDFRGRHLLVSFGYTACPDICPLQLDTVVAALTALGPLADRLQPVFVTVDPVTDTPEALRRYLAAFDPRLLGLTGTEAQVRAVAKAYRVHRRRVRTAGPDGTGATLIDHGSLTYLMGPDGAFVTLFPHGTTAERMAEVLRGYLG